jgi:hypothetical protein
LKLLGRIIKEGMEKVGIWEKVKGQSILGEGENELICLAVGAWGYSHKEGADYLGFHYSTVRRLLKEREMSINKADPHARKEGIAEAARIKLDVVERDGREGGREVDGR